MRINKGIQLLFFILLVHTGSAQLYINEVQSSNHSTITDEDGDYNDWIELYNASSVDVNISGWYLSDTDENPKRWPIPDTIIPSHGYLIIWASGKNRKIGSLHTNFKISSDGEPILLTDASGITFDRFPPIRLEPDQSYGRTPDGGTLRETFHTATPGKSNLINGQTQRMINLLFDQPQGYQSEEFEVTILATQIADIRYTLDGSNPNSSSPIFDKPIAVTSLEGTPNEISDIRSGHGDHWKKPRGEVPKIRVIRARPYIGNKAVGPEISGSFWTGHHNPEEIDIPIVSFIVHPDHFFDYHEGIYIPGVDYDSLGRSNAWRKGIHTEKPAIFTYFDEHGTHALQQLIGVRINGGGTRNAGQKSLRMYARNRYGTNTFDYPFFPERSNHHYRRLLLNTTQGDYSKSLFKDELTTNLVKPLGLEYQAFRPVLVFINGEYWALHFLKERRDQHYLGALADEKPENIHHLFRNRQVSSGSNAHYNQMRHLLEQSNPTDPDILDAIGDYIDVESYIDYHIVQLFLANYDWPHNNIDFWRTNDANSRWRWIFYDLDASFRKYDLDNITTYFREHDDRVDRAEWAYTTMRQLMVIPAFRERFHHRFYELMQSLLTTDNLLREIEAIRTQIEPYVDDYVYRWRIPSTITEWGENVKSLETFARLRPAEVHRILKKNLNKPFSFFPNPGTDKLHLRWKTHPGSDLDIQMYDMSGRRMNITHNNLTPNDAPALAINTNHLEPGVYVLRIRMGGFYFTEKWMKHP